jgi:hypothetical protein
MKHAAGIDKSNKTYSWRASAWTTWPLESVITMASLKVAPQRAPAKRYFRQTPLTQGSRGSTVITLNGCAGRIGAPRLFMTASMLSPSLTLLNFSQVNREECSRPHLKGSTRKMMYKHAATRKITKHTAPIQITTFFFVIASSLAKELLYFCPKTTLALFDPLLTLLERGSGELPISLHLSLCFCYLPLPWSLIC